MPWRRTGGMRQRNQVEAVAGTRDTESATDHVLQLCTVDELRYRQSADWNDEMRPQNSNLIVHPKRTVANLVRRRDAIGAARIFAWETTANSGEVDLRPNSGFVHSAKLFEPAKECFPCCMRKRPFQRWFARSRRLSNDHDIAHDRAAGNWGRLHMRTAPAAE